ncbi:PHP domain-containing protein [Candidatus Bathyarchaeota archaeon]|nr:PHP domain-containing protein [Candidatus Bathyarchaeota archaeon]
MLWRSALTLSLIDKVDFHVHVAERYPYKYSVEEVIREAERRGLSYMTLTDHWRPYDPDPCTFLWERREIDRIKTKVKVFLSAEVDIVDSEGHSPVKPSLHKEIIEAMDYLSAASHLGEPWTCEYGKSRIPMDKLEIIEYEHKKHLSILRNEMFDVILHPYGSTVAWLYREGYAKTFSLKEIPEVYLREFAEYAALYGKGVEINNVPLAAEKEGVKGYERITEGYETFIKILLEKGAKLTIGSDCHYCDKHWHWPGWTKEAVQIIKRCGGSDEDLWLPKGIR